MKLQDLDRFEQITIQCHDNPDADALGAGFGFMLAMIIFSGIRERMEGNDVPKFWQGLPITLVAAALVTCTFLGFTGVIENMFGA